MTRKQFMQRIAVGMLAVLLGAVCVFLVAGCSSSAPSSSDTANTDTTTTGTPQVTGTITSISDGELLINATANSDGSLSGTVRVDTSQIAKDTLDALKVGDTVLIEYPGIVGLSEPPYISANSIQVVQ